MKPTHCLSSKVFNALVFGLFAFMMVACGGGGGDGDDEDVAVNTERLLKLNNQNATAVSGLVVDAAMGGMTAGSLGSPVIAAADTANMTEVDFSIAAFARDLPARIRALASASGDADAFRSPVPSSTTCSGGGSVDAEWNDLGADLSVGDQIILSFNNCVEDGLKLDGEVSVYVLHMHGDPGGLPPWDITFRINYDALRATEDGYTVEVAGTTDAFVEEAVSGTHIVEVTTDVDVGNNETASSFLYFGEEGYGFTELSHFTIHLQENSDSSFSMYCQGTLESSLIGGTVTFETTRDVTGFNFDEDSPTDGEIMITGANNTQIRLRALSSGQVELTVDDEGDGFDSQDSPFHKTWDDLSNAADAL